MQVDYLIIGQGICGTFLSYYLQQAEKNCLVIDDAQPNSPSRIAAGVINPVTGRRLITVWMADEILPHAWHAYQQMGHFLEIEAISQRTIIDFFPNPFMREGFIQKIESGDQYTHAYPEQNHFNQSFNYEFGCGEIRPAYTAHLDLLLPAWRSELKATGALREAKFDLNLLQVHSDHITYEDITAQKIIFCDGVSSFENPYFKLLPFAPNKGEAMVVRIPGLPNQHIFKKSMTLVPLNTPDYFWLGSSYLWDFDSTEPSTAFREQVDRVLKEWVKLPYTIEEHRSGLRPATLERRPFVGIHPLHPNIGILNGMGTKGCSLAPFFAHQLCEHLVNDETITPEADVKRFTKILGRN
jgi:glycine/D-amino acid oxidase-like deaminating enzyme